MIIKETNGDLLQAIEEGKIVAHGCNCFHAMRSGVAGALSDRYSEIPKADFDTKYSDLNKLGKIDVVHIHKEDGSTKAICVNAYTQYAPGKNGDYGAVAMCFKRINDWFNGNTIYIPRVGAGIAGLDWEKVKQIINIVTPDIDVIVLVPGLEVDIPAPIPKKATLAEDMLV